MNFNGIKSVASTMANSFGNLEQMISKHEALVAQRDSLNVQIEALETQIAETANRLNLDVDGASGFSSSDSGLTDADKILSEFHGAMILRTREIQGLNPDWSRFRISRALNKLVTDKKLARVRAGLYQLANVPKDQNVYAALLQVIEANPGIDANQLARHPELRSLKRQTINVRLGWLRHRNHITMDGLGYYIKPKRV